MPPLALIGQVTKAGVMAKTVTVTVSRKIIHPKVGKARRNSIFNRFPADPVASRS
jgi:small subunit ribosomal protein S17